MSSYWFNRQDILQKARYSKEKAAECYLKNKEAIEEKTIDHYKNLLEEKKNKIKKYQKRGIKNWFSIKKKR